MNETPSKALPCWHLITGAYPPKLGGVSDYSRLVAHALADRGRPVHVWTPETTGRGLDRAHEGVIVHRLPDRFGPASLRILSAELRKCPGTNRLLVQYVPHMYGYKAMNVPFCAWVAARRKEQVWVMFHEVAFPFGSRPRRTNLTALANRLMALLLVNRATRVFVSIPGWRPLLEKLRLTELSCEWLPIPSLIPTTVSKERVADLRSRVVPRQARLLGHFGTFGPKVVPLLDLLLPPLLTGHAERRLLLIGRGSREMRERLVARHAALGEQIRATGALSASELAHQIAGCELMIQPYPDGLSSRRSSMMAPLALGVPVVSNLGELTDQFWMSQSAISVVREATPQAYSLRVRELLGADAQLEVLRRNAIRVYEQNFSLQRTVRGLLDAEDSAARGGGHAGPTVWARRSRLSSKW